MHAKFSALLCTVSLVAGCGSEDANPNGTVQVALGASTRDPAIAAFDAAQGGIFVEEAWLSIGSMDFVACDAAQGPLGASDLVLELTGVPFLALFDTNVLEYCGVSLTLATHAGQVAAAPPELTTATSVITGTRADGTPFRITRSSADVFQLTPADGQPFDARYLFLGLDIATWFDGVDLSQIPADPGSGVVIVDAESTPEILSALDAGFAASAALYQDANRDGQLGPGESAPTASSR